jgi:hypothetical protein
MKGRKNPSPWKILENDAERKRARLKTEMSILFSEGV